MAYNPAEIMGIAFSIARANAKETESPKLRSNVYLPNPK